MRRQMPPRQLPREPRNAKSDLDLAKAQSELAVMAAQIAALRKYRQKSNPALRSLLLRKPGPCRVLV